MQTEKILALVQKPFMKAGLPKFRPGDTVRVHVRVIEGESERVQPFEGVVIKKKGSGITENFTVRKISYGIGIERTFPLNSARIDKIEVLRSGYARRAKLFYLRALTGKAARLTDKEDFTVGSSDLKAPKVAATAAAPEPAAAR